MKGSVPLACCTDREAVAAFINSLLMLSITCTLIDAYLHIRKSWEPPAQPTKKFTANRLQFLGIITREYLDQIRPVERNGKFKDISDISLSLEADS